MKKLLLALCMLFVSQFAYANETVTGAGATFPYPIYAKWAEEYRKATGNLVNYQSVGSGAGIKQIQSKTVTFGASDMPLSEAQLKKDNLIQFPMVIGGNVVAFNIEGVKSNELVLTGELIADIYLGKIIKWNDQKIASLNPNVKLPDQNIVVIRRSDGSGTTYLFTKYLAEVSSEWKSKVGSGTAIEWPTGVGARGNEGVAANVAMTKGAIGYVEYAYAKQNNLTYSAIKVGDAVLKAGLQSFQSNWPIAAPTFIIMHQNAVNKQQSKKALDFFQWCYDNGDALAEQLDYVPLSKEQKLKNAEDWKNIQ